MIHYKPNDIGIAPYTSRIVGNRLNRELTYLHEGRVLFGPQVLMIELVNDARAAALALNNALYDLDGIDTEEYKRLIVEINTAHRNAVLRCQQAQTATA